MKKIPLKNWDELDDRVPTYAIVANVDLVVVRYDDQVSVLYGRCQHRGALMSDGRVEGDNLICEVHNWDYRYDTGISSYSNQEKLHKFSSLWRPAQAPGVPGRCDLAAGDSGLRLVIVQHILHV